MTHRTLLVDLPYAFTFGYLPKRGSMKYATCRRILSRVVPVVDDVREAFLLPGDRTMPVVLEHRGGPLVPLAVSAGRVADASSLESILSDPSVSAFYPVFGSRPLASLPDYQGIAMRERTEGDEPSVLDALHAFADGLRSTPRGLFLAGRLPVVLVSTPSAGRVSMRFVDASRTTSEQLLSPTGGWSAVPAAAAGDTAAFLRVRGFEVDLPEHRIGCPFDLGSFFAGRLADVLRRAASWAEAREAVLAWDEGRIPASDLAASALGTAAICGDAALSFALELAGRFAIVGVDPQMRKEAERTPSDDPADDEALVGFGL